MTADAQGASASTGLLTSGAPASSCSGPAPAFGGWVAPLSKGSVLNQDPALKTCSLQAVIKRHRALRSGSLDRDTPFSWIRSVVFLFSYLLLLTDMFRTTIAIRHVHYTPLEPSVSMPFGPYGYPVVHIPWNATSDETARVWSYKFDTTSVAIRAVAQFFRLASWPPCMLYKSHCESARIAYPTVFRMLDSLVESVAQRNVRRKRERPGLALRTENVYYDRVHHYVFPFFFQTNRMRTVHALYYNIQTVADEQFQFCARGSSQPFTCGDGWINFNSTCSVQNAPCVASRLMWTDIVANTRTLARTYPGLRMDMLLIEGYEDRGLESISLQGHQQYDVTIMTRIRNCTQGLTSSTNECSTVAVDDYRYEGESLSTNVVDWSSAISVIRAIGQGYAYVRMASLFLGCYKARSAEPELIHASFATQVRATIRTMFTAPSQVVTYGSMVPVFAYTAAHLIDCSMVYEAVFEEFTTLVGKFHLDIGQFIRVATVSMRSLWILATVLHVAVFLSTRGRFIPTAKGIPGIPEFTISVTAFLTISAQYRSLSFRNTEIVSIMEVITSERGRNIRASRYNNSRQLAYLLCLGDPLDAKFLTASLLVVTGCSVLIYGSVYFLSHLKLMVTHELTLWPHSIVSYAAGTLWPVNALMVSWEGAIITPVGVKRYLPVRPSYFTKRNSVFVSDTPRARKSSTSFIVNKSEESLVIQNSIAYLGGRSSAVNATLYLMNLTVMSDPIVLSRLYWFGGQEIGIYWFEDQLFFLPLDLEKSRQNLRMDYSRMELLGSVNTMDLAFSDLLQCG